MDELLKALYDSFYEPPRSTEEKQEIKDCHRRLIEKLDKPERKLVLRIIDAKDRTAELLSIDSFIAGFQLAWRLASELHIREQQHPIMTRKISCVILNAIWKCKSKNKNAADHLS